VGNNLGPEFGGVGLPTMLYFARLMLLKNLTESISGFVFFAITFSRGAHVQFSSLRPEIGHCIDLIRVREKARENYFVALS